ncbi:17206_t:CDS:2, partial [Racocetra fulgida]
QRHRNEKVMHLLNDTKNSTIGLNMSETLEAAYTMWNDHKNQKDNITSSNVLNQGTKVNQKYNLGENNLQKICSIWMDKVACVVSPLGLQKHTDKRVCNTKTGKCKDIGNSPPSSNKGP